MSDELALFPSIFACFFGTVGSYHLFRASYKKSTNGTNNSDIELCKEIYLKGLKKERLKILLYHPT